MPPRLDVNKEVNGTRESEVPGCDIRNHHARVFFGMEASDT
jgi:hypothetical protein